MAGATNFIERFNLEITTANESTKGTFEIDNAATIVTGVTFTSDRDDLLFYRGSLKLEVNDAEQLPEGYEAKLVMTGLNISPNARVYELNTDSGNNIVELTYQDSSHANAAFVPYRVTIYVHSQV